MSHIRFLGTGSGMPHPSRMTSSILIEGPKGALLLDAGEGCSQHLARPDIWSQEVRSILITHRHSDHLAGLPMLLNGFKHSGRETALDIWVAHGLLEPLREWLDFLHIGARKQPFPLAWRRLEPGRFTPANGLRGEVWQNDHLPMDDAGGSHSLKIELGRHTWLFSGDLGSFMAIEPYLDHVHGLVVESRHVDPAEAASRAFKSGVKRVFLTHVAPDRDTPPIDGAEWAYDNLVIEA